MKVGDHVICVEGNHARQLETGEEYIVTWADLGLVSVNRWPDMAWNPERFRLVSPPTDAATPDSARAGEGEG